MDLHDQSQYGTDLDDDSGNPLSEEAVAANARPKYRKYAHPERQTPVANCKVGLNHSDKEILAHFEALAFDGKNAQTMTQAQRSFLLKQARQKAKAYSRAENEAVADAERVAKKDALYQRQVALASHKFKPTR
jgi:hypothetical protein